MEVSVEWDKEKLTVESWRTPILTIIEVKCKNTNKNEGDWGMAK